MSKADAFVGIVSDLQRWQGADDVAIARATCGTVAAGRAEFDTDTGRAFGASGRSVSPFGGSVRFRPGAVTVEAHVSGKKEIAIERFPISPGLGSDTTGARRAEISAELLKGKAYQIENGFVWHGRIMRRIDNTRHITHAKSGISPGEYLSRFRNEVASEMTKHLDDGITRELK